MKLKIKKNKIPIIQKHIFLLELNIKSNQLEKWVARNKNEWMVS